MLEQGFILMVAGIGTVAVFLSLMVVVMQLSGAYFEANEDRFMEKALPGPKAGTVRDENEIIAAVLAAVTAHSRK